MKPRFPLRRFEMFPRRGKVEEIHPALRQEIKTHLQACKHCQVVEDSPRKTLRIVACGHVIELPAGFSARLKARLEDVLHENSSCGAS